MRFFRKKKPVPDGLFMKCKGCGGLVYRKNVEERDHVCPECDYHFRINVWDRINLHTDEGSFEEIDGDLQPADPLNFSAKEDYTDKLEKDKEKTGLNEAVVCGTCTINGREAVFACLDFRFRGGSMGSVMGEKITRAVETAKENNLPLVTVASSGGARMQESALSLMQMAKTCSALQRFHESGGAYISIMTHPTTGGVTASWSSMGDVILAEPKALIGFAGRRVIEQTINEQLPEDFQTAEFLLEHGFIDRIVPRSELKDNVSRLIDYLAPQN